MSIQFPSREQFLSCHLKSAHQRHPPPSTTDDQTTKLSNKFLNPLTVCSPPQQRKKDKESERDSTNYSLYNNVTFLPQMATTGRVTYLFPIPYVDLENEPLPCRTTTKSLLEVYFWVLLRTIDQTSRFEPISNQSIYRPSHPHPQARSRGRIITTEQSSSSPPVSLHKTISQPFNYCTTSTLSWAWAPSNMILSTVASSSSFRPHGGEKRELWTV